MLNYSFIVTQAVEKFNGADYQFNKIDITVTGGKFLDLSSNFFVRVFDTNNLIDCFLYRISENGKVVSAYFTSDAFGVFPGNVTIEFGYNNMAIGSFSAIDINAVIAPLGLLSASLGASMADNTWLDSIS